MVVPVGRDLRLAGHLDDHLLLHRHQGALEVQQEHGHPHQQRGKVSLGFISFGHTWHLALAKPDILGSNPTISNFIG